MGAHGEDILSLTEVAASTSPLQDLEPEQEQTALIYISGLPNVCTLVPRTLLDSAKCEPVEK